MSAWRILVVRDEGGAKGTQVYGPFQSGPKESNTLQRLHTLFFTIVLRVIPYLNLLLLVVITVAVTIVGGLLFPFGKPGSLCCCSLLLWLVRVAMRSMRSL